MSTRTVSMRPLMSLALGVLLLVGIMVALAAASEVGAVDPLVAKRGVAISIGLTMMLTGNFLPKLLLPAAAPRRGPFTSFSAERFAGWTFVLAGLAYVVVLAAAPLSYAMPVAAVIGLGAFALAGANWVGSVLGAPRVNGRAGGESSPDTGSESEPTNFEAGKRLALLNLFVGFFWAYATFLADALWGDRASRLMAMGFAGVFAAGNVLLLQRLFARPRRPASEG